MRKIKEQSAAYCRVAAGRQAVTARRERERDYWNTLTHTHTQSLHGHAYTHTPNGDTRKVRYVYRHADVLFCNLSVLQDTLEQIVTRQPKTENVAILHCTSKSHWLFFCRPASIFQVLQSFFSPHTHYTCSQLNSPWHKHSLILFKAIFEIQPFALRVR